MRISVAIPDSALDDESTRLEKTRKASIIARACAIFGTETVYVYGDRADENDVSLLNTILRYAETPQYLRKRLFPRVNELKYAGVVHPLQIPSHMVTNNLQHIKVGHIRDGVVTLSRGLKFVDVGLGRLITYHGKARAGTRITVQFKTDTSEYKIKEIDRSEVKEYWGYETKLRGNLIDLLRSWEGRIIITSRKGRINTESARHQHKSKTLVVFGTRGKGLPEILGNRINKIQKAPMFNFFPNQRSATVRLEEALFGVLSILDSVPNTVKQANA